MSPPGLVAGQYVQSHVRVQSVAGPQAGGAACRPGNRSAYIVQLRALHGSTPRSRAAACAAPRRCAACDCVRTEPRQPNTLLLLYTCRIRTRA